MGESSGCVEAGCRNPFKALVMYPDVEILQMRYS
jgi:hypothetical protein